MCSSASIHFTGEPAPLSQAGLWSNGLGCCSMRDHEGQPEPLASGALTPGCRSEDAEQPRGAGKHHPTLSWGSVLAIISVVKVTGAAVLPRASAWNFHCSQRKERAAVQGLDSVPESAPSITTGVHVLSDVSLHLGDADSGLKTPLWSCPVAVQGQSPAWGSYSGPLTPGLKTLNPKVRFLEPLVTEETTASQSC